MCVQSVTLTVGVPFLPMIGSILPEVNQNELAKSAAVVVSNRTGVSKCLWEAKVYMYRLAVFPEHH